MRTHTGPGLQRARGQGVAEFAIAVTVFLVAVMALMEGGRLVYTIGSLAHATQSGGRVAIIPLKTKQQVKDAVVAAAQSITIDPNDIAIAVNNCSTDACFTARTTGDRVKVTVSYTYNYVALPGIFGTAPRSLTRQTEYMVE